MLKGNKRMQIIWCSEKQQDYKVWTLEKSTESLNWNLQHKSILHRESGPAIEYKDGTKEWWYNDKHIPVDNQEDFERYIKIMFLE